MPESSNKAFHFQSDLIYGAQDKTSAELNSRTLYRMRITAKELHTCIIASELTRSICSIFIALLVALSHIEYPLHGVNYVSSKSIVATAKPLYMVLLSDVTAMAAYFLIRKRQLSISEEMHKKASLEEYNWDRAFMVMERGLVVHQMIRAIFIDCSVYVVIVACGLSIVKPLS